MLSTTQMSGETWDRFRAWSVVAIAAALVVIGWVAIARYEDLSEGSGRLLRQQMIWSAIALAAAVGAAIPSCRVLSRWSYGIFALAAAMLVAVYFFAPINGAQRWIRIGPLGFQPSELAKIALVLALARYLMYRHDHRRLLGLLVPLGLTLLPMLLILREPDLGTALVLLPVALVMLFCAGARRIDLARLVLLGLLIVPLLWMEMSREQRSRVTSWLDQAGPEEVATGDAYHLRQAKQILALGNRWGSLCAGQAVDDPAVYHLPEAGGDFIFCIVGERLGLPGMALVLLLYAMLAWRGLAIAAAAADPFARLVAVGLVAVLGAQVLVNTAMTVGLLPITGISLPLVSYGGSGLVAQGISLGLLVNIGLRPGCEVGPEPFRYSASTRTLSTENSPTAPSIAMRRMASRARGGTSM